MSDQMSEILEKWITRIHEEIPWGKTKDEL